MVSLQRSRSTTAHHAEPPRISFSGDFMINGQIVISKESPKARAPYDPDFEFLSADSSDASMLTADELFFEGRLLPFWPAARYTEEPNHGNISLKAKLQGQQQEKQQGGGASWFVDEDPSPRLPKCTVLWMELLKLKRQQSSMDDEKDGSWKRKKKGLERRRSASVRIRPVLKLPICTSHGRNNVLPM